MSIIYLHVLSACVNLKLNARMTHRYVATPCLIYRNSPWPAKKCLNQPYRYYKSLARAGAGAFRPGFARLLGHSLGRCFSRRPAWTDVFSNELGFDKVMRSPWQDEIDEMMRKEGFGPHIISNYSAGRPSACILGGDNSSIVPSVRRRLPRWNHTYTALRAML